VKVQRTETEFADYDNRNDAGTQNIASFKIEGTVETLIDYKVFTNRAFDASHNVSNQTVLTYASKSSADPYDVQEIRSYNFNAQGVALRQIVVNFKDAAKTKQIRVQETVNSDIDA
jgi:hypothetical protein